MERLSSHWTEFHEIWQWKDFEKSASKIQVLLKSDNYYGHFTWRRMFICGDKLATFVLEWEMFHAELVAIIEHLNSTNLPEYRAVWYSRDRASLMCNDLLDQLDATIMIYWWTNNTTCFGHHCAHLQECKAVHYCTWFSALKVLAGVLGRREAGRVHCVEAVFRLSRKMYIACIVTVLVCYS